MTLKFYAKKSKACATTKQSKCDILIEQLVNSSVVGGITWLSTVSATALQGTPSFSWEGFAIGFGLTFLIKLKEYRKIA